VTVTGPGGVGKTRLAAQVSRRVAGWFADGVWVAELALVREPALVLAAVAVALGIRQAPGMSISESLVAVLARRQLLIVLAIRFLPLRTRAREPPQCGVPLACLLVCQEAHRRSWTTPRHRNRGGQLWEAPERW